MKKENAILFGPNIGEFGWELQRSAPIIPYLKRKKYKKQRDIKFIILTRQERFDLYGKFADILVPLKIPGDYEIYMPNCYRLDNFAYKEYEKIVNKFYKKYSERFNILEHIYPKIKNKLFTQKHQFPISQMIFEFSPRKRNYEIIDEHIPKDKPIIIISPRYRNNTNDPSSIKRRNWGHWNDLYDMICNSKLWKNFTFVICGKTDEYIPDKKDRFYDISKIKTDDNSSLAGLLLVLLETAVFTCGSQSAIPNLSLLKKVEVLEFGHQRSLHTKSYNVFNTKITFLDDRKYNIKPKIIFDQLNNLVQGKIKK